MISVISFKNFKALRSTRLQLGRYNLIVGPNGSGKSTLLAGLQVISRQRQFRFQEVRTLGTDQDPGYTEIAVQWKNATDSHPVQLGWVVTSTGVVLSPKYPDADVEEGFAEISKGLVFALSEEAIAAPVQLQPQMKLASNGGGLAGVLDRMRDESPEVFEQLNEEIARLLPEFDRILFETPSPGARGLMLRTREGKHAIRGVNLSQGVLLALALLTLSYLPDPPSIVGLEEPDRGIHPRLYRDVQDALYRLSYPESFGIDRAPVQVIVTTHSPFMLDLHKDHPEEIVIAERTEHGSEFHRLSERPDLAELLDEVSLGEAWYSGILGGVPAAP